jgi:predicted DNA-binding protein with PD1-like motif
MRIGLSLVLLAALAGGSCAAQTVAADEGMISPARAVPKGNAPGMKSKLVKDTPEEKVYSVVFYKGDEVLSGLTDFALAHQVADAHFTAIGAVSGATLAWLDLGKKAYRKIPVTQQVEVLSLVGDIARSNGVPVVHMHAVLGKPDGSTVGGHVFELHVNPTLEVFLTVNTTPLEKRPDEASGMKVIDPAR